MPLLPEPAVPPPELPELPALDAPPERSVLLAELPPEALPAARALEHCRLDAASLVALAEEYDL